ncbi:MAG: flagellar protein FlaG [Magnetococcales bacterium]|nr:flagellar protein FlaG [Magnetococcales bacterium]
MMNAVAAPVEARTNEDLYRGSPDLRLITAGSNDVERALMESLVDEVVEALTSFSSLRLDVDPVSKKLMVCVTDTGADTIMKRISSEQMMDLIRTMRSLEKIMFGKKLSNVS